MTTTTTNDLLPGFGKHFPPFWRSLRINSPRSSCTSSKTLLVTGVTLTHALTTSPRRSKSSPSTMRTANDNGNTWHWSDDCQRHGGGHRQWLGLP
jgi:hypothetical protein